MGESGAGHTTPKKSSSAFAVAVTVRPKSEEVEGGVKIVVASSRMSGKRSAESSRTFSTFFCFRGGYKLDMKGTRFVRSRQVCRVVGRKVDAGTVRRSRSAIHVGAEVAAT